MSAQRHSLLLSCIVLLAIPSEAAEQEIWTTDGTCEQLVIADKDLTARCRSALGHVLHANGRMDIGAGLGWFTNPLYSFGGWPPDGQKAWSNHDVDLITISSNETDQETSQRAVEGACRYSTSTATNMFVSCEAVDAKGRRYSLRYRTDDIGPSRFEP